MTAPQACHDEGMSETFKMRVGAGPGNTFSPTAFDRQVGEAVTVQAATGDMEGTILAAEVVEDGAAVEVTVEVPDGTLTEQALAGYSIADQSSSSADA